MCIVVVVHLHKWRHEYRCSHCLYFYDTNLEFAPEVNKKYSFESLCTRTCFETEVKGNWEIAYSLGVIDSRAWRDFSLAKANLRQPLYTQICERFDLSRSESFENLHYRTSHLLFDCTPKNHSLAAHD